MSGGGAEARVSVLYGRGIRSGGPEALHQLVHELRREGVAASLVPHPRTIGRPRVVEYEGYDAPELAMSNDNPHDVIIAPEVYLPELLRFKRARRLCWWLSIDNSPAFRAERYLEDLKNGLADWPRARELRSLAWLTTRELSQWRPRLHALGHLSQSHYARAYLRRRLGVDSMIVSDYISDAEARIRCGEQAEDRGGLRISYNPAKGARLVNQVRRRAGLDAVWVPIAGMSPDQVRTNLAQSAVYLDLGPHPGKDRIPREAALAGAVVVVARRGSACHDADVPLPDLFRIPVANSLADRTVDVLGLALRNHESALLEQEPYRNHIIGQRAAFNREVKNLAKMILDGGASG